MKLLGITSNPPTMGTTKTYDNFATFVGAAPYRMGLMADLYPSLSTTSLLEGLLNVFYQKKTADRFQQINSTRIDWDIKVNKLPRPEFAADAVGTGQNGSRITFFFKTLYYRKYDKFRIERSRQDIYVLCSPIRRSDGMWQVEGCLIDTDRGSVLDASACKKGMRTRWMGNNVPELDNEGFTKYQSNVERHTNWIGSHRNDVEWSADYAAMEDVFIKVGEGKPDANGIYPTVKTLHLLSKEQELLDTWTENKNLNLLFSKSSMDINGRSIINDPQTGLPVIMGDGIIPQIERYALKFYPNQITLQTFKDIMKFMSQISKEPIGNQYVIICNQMFWDDLQDIIFNFLINMRTTNGTWFFSAMGGEGVGRRLSVGNTFESFNYSGNQLSFKVDKSLTFEYPEQPYAVCLDMSGDVSKNTPAIGLFTMRGQELTKSYLVGAGGMDGQTSGEVSTPVSGSRLIYRGKGTAVVFNPYKAVIVTGAPRYAV